MGCRRTTIGSTHTTCLRCSIKSYKKPQKVGCYKLGNNKMAEALPTVIKTFYYTPWNILIECETAALQQGYTVSTHTLHPRYTHITLTLHPHCTHVKPTLHSHYSHVTPTLHPHYTHVTPTLHPRYTHVTLTLHSRYTHVTLT